ncbi:MAG TPA: tetratricopeptide repeat protein [Drouetiella sp.]
MIFVSKSTIRRSVLISLSVSTAMAGFSSLPSFAKVTDWDKQLSSGYNQLTLGNTEKALDFFRKQSAKNPQSGACHLGVGKCLKRLMKISEAKQEFRTATELEPTLADAWYELGVVSESDQEWDNAVKAFNKFLELKPDAATRQAVVDRIRFCEGKKPNT